MVRFEIVDDQRVVQNSFEFEMARSEYRSINGVRFAYFYHIKPGTTEKNYLAGPIQIYNDWSVRVAQWRVKKQHQISPNWG